MTYIPYPRLRVALASARRPLCGVLSLALILSFLATSLPGSSLATSRPAPTGHPWGAALTPSLADLPIAFVPNVGQSDPSVHFQAQGLGGMLFFTPAEIVLTLPASSAESDVQTVSTAASPAALKPQIEAAPASERENVVRLSFLGANPRPSISSDEQMSGIVNYLLGNDPSQWRTNVPTYAALRYEQLYPGIDLRYDGEGGRLKGTYLVAAGADPGQIRWHYGGVNDVTVDAEGNLVATLPQAGTPASKAMPTLREAAPIAWQTIDGQQVPVEVRYNLHSDKTIGFVIGAYDRSLPLVLDPTLDYSSYAGTNNDDEGRSIAVDGTGSIYIIGTTNTDTTGIDTFVTKLDPDPEEEGTDHLVYTTFLGGSNTDLGNGIVVTNQGQSHIVGSTYSNNFPNVTGLDTTLGGETDAFVTTLSITGTATFSTYLGGTQKDFGNGITIDASQNLYLTGRTESPDFPLANERDNKLDGPADAFITKIAASRTSYVYSTYLGGTRSDTSNAIAIDGAGNTFVTGQTSSLDFPTLGGARPPVFAGGISDAFVTKLSNDGRLLTYSTYLGGEEFDEGMSIAVDSEQRAYITGTTQSTTFPTANTQSVFQGRTDAFFTRVNRNGSALEYSTYLGGTSDDSGQDIVVDDQNSAYIIGSTKSYNFPNKDAVQSTRNGDIDAFVTKFLPTGSAIEYSTYFGGTSDDYGYGIAAYCPPPAPGVTPKCSAYITGTATSRDFPTIEGSWKPNYNGGAFDAFVAQLGPIPTGPRIYVEPPMKFIGLNQTFSVDIMVDSADKDIDTVDAYLAFNPTYLQVVDKNGNPINSAASPPTEPISTTVDLNEVRINYNQMKVENGVGQIGFSASKLVKTATGTKLLPRKFTAGKIYFRTLQTTTNIAPTTISFVRQGARHSDLYLGGVTRNAATVSSNIRILSGSLLNGKISLEQRGAPSSPRWATPLYRGTEDGIIVYDNWSSGDPQRVGFVRTDTDNDGRFSVFLRDVVGDDYVIKVKGADTLSNMRHVNLQTTNEIDFGTLCVGDTSGNDVINGADVSYIVPFFPSDDTLPNFPTEGDANKDRRIDREDLNSIKANFLKTGYISETTTLRGCNPPATRSAAVGDEEPAQTAFTPQSPIAAVADKEPAQAAFAPQSSIAAERAVISLYPEDQEVIAGQIFTVTLNIDQKGNQADTLDMYLNVDPDQLIMVDKEGKVLEAANSQGKLDLHTNALANNTCEVTYNNATTNTYGENNASITCFKTPFLPDTFTAATFYFKFKHDSEIDDTAKITLITEGTTLEDKVRTTNLYKNGAAVDTSRLGATVTRFADGSVVYFPFAAKP